MDTKAMYAINQTIGYGWSANAILVGVVLICYFARNWPPQFSKIRFQLVLALAVMFITQGVREYIGTSTWDDMVAELPHDVVERFQYLRLQLQIPKVIMAGAGLFVIRALSWELYGNKLAIVVAVGMLVASLGGLYWATS